MTTLYRGILISADSVGAMRVTRDGAMIVEDGRIKYSGPAVGVPQELEPNIKTISAKIILPGLIDLHTHLPQYPLRGTGRGELLDWLNDYVFPEEARHADAAYSAARARHFFSSLIKNGTTTAVVFTAPFKNAACEAFKAAKKAGIRAIIGRTMMDFNCPSGLGAAATANIGDSMELARCWHGADGGRLQYAMTPRFAGSCSFELLQRAGELARREGFYIQTHLSENLSEIEFIKNQFQNFENYTEVYEKAGVLTDKTILAHAIHLNHNEIEAIRRNDCAIAHCPTSNIYLRSGIMPLRGYLEKGIRVGLGTDVAGGSSYSLFNEARNCRESSKILNIFGASAENIVSAAEALSLATYGGAKALGIENKIGRLADGFEADFLLLNDDDFDLPAEDLSDIELIEKLIYTASPANIDGAYVRGKKLAE